MLLYFIFRCSPRVENATDSHRLVSSAFSHRYQFPSSGSSPGSVGGPANNLLSRRGRHSDCAPKSSAFAFVCLLAALLSLGQAMMRADVPVALGIAILLSAAWPFRFPARAPTSPFWDCVWHYGGHTAIHAVRRISQRHLFPTTPRFQLLANLNLLHPPMHIPIFLTALLPLIVSLVLLRRHHLPLDPPTTCPSHPPRLSPTMVTMGLVVEVRIFVPSSSLRRPPLQSFGQPTCSTMSMVPSPIGPIRSSRLPIRMIHRTQNLASDFTQRNRIPACGSSVPPLLHWAIRAHSLPRTRPLNRVAIFAGALFAIQMYQGTAFYFSAAA